MKEFENEVKQMIDKTVMRTASFEARLFAVENASHTVSSLADSLLANSLLETKSVEAPVEERSPSVSVAAPHYPPRHNSVGPTHLLQQFVSLVSRQQSNLEMEVEGVKVEIKELHRDSSTTTGCS